MNTIKILDKTPFHKMHIGVGNLPSSYLDSLSYYEQLAFLTDYIVNTIIPKVNENITLTNSLIADFTEIKKDVEKAEKDVATLTQEVLDLTAELAKQIAEAKNYTDTEIAKLTIFLENIINSQITPLETKLESEVARLDEKIEHYPIANVLVQNSIKGYETSIQTYLDDITHLLRRGGITAGEYDALELTASEYDSKEITAYRYDFYGQFELTGSTETDSIILYNQTGQNTDGAMTQKAVTDALANAGGGGSVAFTNHHNLPYASFDLSNSDVIGSGIIKCDETDDGLINLHGQFNFRSGIGTDYIKELTKIDGTNYRGLYIGSINYHPTEVKKVEYCYTFIEGGRYPSLELAVQQLISTFYLPLIIDTNGNLYVYCQEENWETPTITLSSSTTSYLSFNTIIDVKNALSLNEF